MNRNSIPTGYRHIQVNPIAGALGAEIRGIDISADLDAPTIKEIQRAWNDYLVLFFHHPDLSAERQRVFTSHFGSVIPMSYATSMAGNPEVTALVREAEVPPEVRNLGGDWHCDGTFLPNPPLGWSLYGVDIPPFGGDTMFANMYLAYETLSDGMKETCDRLTGIHCGLAVYGDPSATIDPRKKAVASGVAKGLKYEISEEHRREVEHPLVRVHATTGKKSLFLSGNYLMRFKGMTEKESLPLINFLTEHSTRAELTCRFRWSKGSLTLLDNRCTNHFAVNDYYGFRREMHRLIMHGERPLGGGVTSKTAGTMTESA